MKNTIIWILLAGAAAGAGFTLKQVPEPKPDMTEYYQHQIDSIKNCNKQLDSIISKNNEDRVALEDSIAKVGQKIATKEANLKKLRKEYEDKINNIDHLSSDELTELLTKRYQ